MLRGLRQHRHLPILKANVENVSFFSFCFGVLNDWSFSVLWKSDSQFHICSMHQDVLPSHLLFRLFNLNAQQKMKSTPGRGQSVLFP